MLLLNRMGISTQHKYTATQIDLKCNEDFVHHYGLIRNPDNRKVLLNVYQESGLKCFPVIVNDEMVTVLNIQGEFIYQRGDKKYGICEYNEGFRLLDGTRDARWRFTETEYKVNILENQEDYYRLFPYLELSGFSISHSPQEFRSVETMFYPYPDSYFSLLRWENERAYNAVKVKKIILESPILSRDTLIVDYSPQLLSHIFWLFRTDYDGFVRGSSTFVKKKQRFVAVDNERGYVFGVSYNVSDFEGQLFCQIELEYWSRIVSQVDIPSDDSSGRLCSHLKLIESMHRYLTDNGIRYDNEQLQKNIWLQKIAKSKMK